MNGVLFEFVESILLQCIKLKGVECLKSTSSVDSVTHDDLEILVYIVGFVISKLKKFVNRITNSNKEKMSDIVNLLCFNNESGKEMKKYASWTEKMSRGGLQIPSDDFFCLIRHIEFIVRGDVNFNSTSGSDVLLNSRLSSVILENTNVTFLWDKVVPNPSKLSEFLLKKIVKLFLTVRGFSYAKVQKAKLGCDQAGTNLLGKT